MEPIAEPRSNIKDPDEVLVQTIASHAGWQIDGQGHIYDKDGVFVSKSLTSAAAVMRKLGWFTPLGSEATGINWRRLHGVDDVSTAVRHASP
jgi:hypothetical protein